MRTVSILLLALAIACEVFAYWGVSTASGRETFDEMAGIIPVAAGAAGFVLALAAAIVWWRGRTSE